MKRALIRAWAWLCAWLETPAGQRAATAFALEVAGQLIRSTDARSVLHILAAGLLSSGVLHASRQGPDPLGGPPQGTEDPKG